MTILLLGDSHLARLRTQGGQDRLESLTGTPVDNRAVGGSTVRALPQQAAGLELSSYDAVVVSLGTNDAAPWGAVPLSDFRSAVAALVDAGSRVRWVALTTPGVDGARTPDGGRGNDVMVEYADALASVVEGAGGVMVRSRDVISALGGDGFVDDGFHLSPSAYDLLLPAIAEAVAAVRH
jgi:lysophospholipase L1-like esterase